MTGDILDTVFHQRIACNRCGADVTLEDSNEITIEHQGRVSIRHRLCGLCMALFLHWLGCAPREGG